MKRIVCFGDSNTYGFIPATGGRLDRTLRWTGLLQQMLPEDEIIEAGFNGRTTVFDDKGIAERNGSRALEQLLGELENADVFLIMLGTNDCKLRFGADAAMIADGLEILVSQIRLIHSSCRIVVMVPAYITENALAGGNYDQTCLQTSRHLRQQYQRLCQRCGCDFLPVCDSVTAGEDGVHLTPASHRKLAELVCDFLLHKQVND